MIENNQRNHQKWYRLDNAATIIPSTVRGADTRVFRLVCELKEDVNPSALQEALDRTAREFPHLCVTLRKGLFWYYLDPVRQRAMVTEENREICAPIYFPGRRNLLYRVSYFRNRINLEMFHVLSDGTGAFIFFEKLLEQYLCSVHGITLSSAADRSSEKEKTDDAFRRFYQKKEEGTGTTSSISKDGQLGKMSGVKAYQIEGIRDEYFRTHAAEILVSAGSFCQKAHEFGATAGILSTALYIQALIEGMSAADLTKPIVISVPVNLRQYFPSETTRNFFGVIIVPYDPADYDGTVQSIIPAVRESFEEQLTEANLRKTMNSYSSLMRNPFLRLVPIPIKDKAIYGFNKRAKRGVTGSMSNVGRIRLPEELSAYVDHFTGFMAAPNMQISVMSFGDRMSFGVASGYAEQSVTLWLCRKLTQMGLDVELSTNDCDLELDRKAMRAAKRAEARRAAKEKKQQTAIQKKEKKQKAAAQRTVTKDTGKEDAREEA